MSTSSSSSSSSSSTKIGSMSSSSSSGLSSEGKIVQANQYRFAGYELPKIQLDETGPSFYQVQPHPYYSTQPAYWEKPAFSGFMPLKSGIIGGESHIQQNGEAYPVEPPPQITGSTQGIIRMIPLE